MKITPLWKAVSETKAKIIKVGDKEVIVVDSTKYKTVRHWFIKGEFSIESNMMPVTLICGRLEKDITISLNRPIVNGEKILEDLANEVRSFVFYHVPTGKYTGKDLKWKDLPAYTEAILRSFERTEDEYVNKKDFIIAVVDWENKNLQFEKIEK